MNNHSSNYNMDNSAWRIRTKAIAFIDLFFVSVQSMVLLLWILFAFAAFTTNSERSDELLATWTKNGLRTLAVVILLQVGLGLWASVQLMNATDLGREAGDAYEFSRSWFLVNFVLIVLNIAFGCMMRTLVWTIIGVLVKMIFICVVVRFLIDAQTTFIASLNQRRNCT